MNNAISTSLYMFDYNVADSSPISFVTWPLHSTLFRNEAVTVTYIETHFRVT